MVVLLLLSLYPLETFVEHWITKIPLNRIPKQKSFGSTNLNSIAQHCFGVCVAVCACVRMLSIKQLSNISSLPSLPVHTNIYIHASILYSIYAIDRFFSALKCVNEIQSENFVHFFLVVISSFVSSFLFNEWEEERERESQEKKVIEVEWARMEGD